MFNSELPISYYKEIGILNDKSDIKIVQHIETHKIYIKKTLKIYNLNVYKYLFFHPIKNMPRIYALYEDQGILTTIEEYISGDTLSDILDICGSLPESDVIDYIQQLCDVLHELHSCNPPIIHRDIKPSNIILTEDKRIVLIDLNAAKQTVDNKTHDTILLGTEDFAAPEQFGFEQSSPKSDIYATGVLIKTLLTGSTTSENINSKKLLPIIKKCTKLGPESRFQTAKQLKKALQWL